MSHARTHPLAASPSDPPTACVMINRLIASVDRIYESLNSLLTSVFDICAARPRRAGIHCQSVPCVRALSKPRSRRASHSQTSGPTIKTYAYTIGGSPAADKTSAFNTQTHGAKTLAIHAKKQARITRGRRAPLGEMEQLLLVLLKVVLQVRLVVEEVVVVGSPRRVARTYVRILCVNTSAIHVYIHVCTLSHLC